jgi:hypothetical protein
MYAVADTVGMNELDYLVNGPILAAPAGLDPSADGMRTHSSRQARAPRIRRDAEFSSRIACNYKRGWVGWPAPDPWRPARPVLRPPPGRRPWRAPIARIEAGPARQSGAVHRLVEAGIGRETAASPRPVVLPIDPGRPRPIPDQAAAG